VRLDALETQPIYHVISQLVYATGRQQVSDVWVAGVRKVENGTLPGFDQAELRGKAQTWRERIANFG
jgi:5-methylthioadenosine/S-adenosylhomocysteine deaminase